VGGHAAVEFYTPYANGTMGQSGAIYHFGGGTTGSVQHFVAGSRFILASLGSVALNSNAGAALTGNSTGWFLTGGPLQLSSPPQFSGTNTTGANTATLGTNSPGATATPYTWIQAKAADGNTVYIPCWK
jgi:hypothetical protein